MYALQVSSCWLTKCSQIRGWLPRSWTKWTMSIIFCLDLIILVGDC
jgi:hypothetical protein